MNYYKLKATVAQRVRDWLQMQADDPKAAEPYSVFMRKLELEYGVSDEMVRKMIQRYGLDIKDGSLIRVIA